MKNILLIICIIFFLYIVYLKGCVIKKDTKSPPKIEVRVDTILIKGDVIHDTITTPPEYVFLPSDTLYIPIADTTYNGLYNQYNTVSAKAKDLYITLNTKNVYKRQYKIDSFGYVQITDTIQNNKLKGRVYKYDLKIPSVTTTIYTKPKTKMFFGVGVYGDKSGIGYGSANILIKTKKDIMFGPSVIADFKNSVINYGASVYFKL